MIKKIVRILITTVALLFLIWFVLPKIGFGILNPGNLLGILICLFLIFRFGLQGLYNCVKEFFYRNKLTKTLWMIFSVLISLFAVYAVIVSGLIVGFSLNSADNTYATAIVLGAEVKPWGPSALLKQRIDSAEKYLKANPKATAVLTGGQGQDEPMSEARCMYENLVKQGIAPSRLFIEDKATNTEENISFSYKIITENKLNPNIAIVTDSYHQFRARIIAQKHNVNGNISSINTKSNNIGILCYPTMFVRELIAIPVELIK